MILHISGYEVVIDEDDYARISENKYRISKSPLNNGGYLYFERDIKVDKKRSLSFLHRDIMRCNYGDGLTVDHKDGNTLDNRKSNLRLCSMAENSRNAKLRIDNKSGYKGVHFVKRLGKWASSIRIGSKTRINLGLFDTAIDAYNAYCKEAEKYHKDFRRLTNE